LVGLASAIVQLILSNFQKFQAPVDSYYFYEGLEHNPNLVAVITCPGLLVQGALAQKALNKS